VLMHEAEDGNISCNELLIDLGRVHAERSALHSLSTNKNPRRISSPVLAHIDGA
jgi:hypothetical protein